MKPVLLLACFAALCSGQQDGRTGPGAARAKWEVSADQQTSEGHIYHLSGHAEMRNADMAFRADRIDYDEDKAVIHLAGNVFIETGNKGALRADDADYDVDSGDLRLKLRLTAAQELLPRAGPQSIE